MPRLLKTVYEIIFLNLLEGSECSGIITPAKCMPQIINLVLVINASSGFLIYCFIGTFGEKFLEVLTVSCRCRRSRSTTVEFQLPASQGLSKFWKKVWKDFSFHLCKVFEIGYKKFHFEVNFRTFLEKLKKIWLDGVV